MNKSQCVRVGMIVLALHTAGTAAPTPVLNGTGGIIGIDGLPILGTDYGVAFREGAFNDIFGHPPDPVTPPLIFTNRTDATAAATAIADYLNGLSPIPGVVFPPDPVLPDEGVPNNKIWVPYGTPGPHSLDAMFAATASPWSVGGQTRRAELTLTPGRSMPPSPPSRRPARCSSV